MKLRRSVENKQKLSVALRNWLPILQVNLCELEEEMSKFAQENPLVRIRSGFEEEFSSRFSKRVLSGDVRNSRTEQIEALTIQEKSLYETLYEQISSPLFPTPISESIAHEVIENLDESGYFEGDIELLSQKLNIKKSEFERVRTRFAHLEPSGIGARDLKESFLFQLEHSTVDDDLYSLATKMIDGFDNIYEFSKEERFEDVMRVIRQFKNPPAIDYFEKSNQAVPDLIIDSNDESGLRVKLNSTYYPDVIIDNSLGIEHDYIKQKLREAKGLIDAMNMRKSTLYKVGLMIVEYQYDFFMGGEIKPLTLKVLADEFGHNPSTISRAISNKYIACSRGIFAMKKFFTTAIDANDDEDEEGVSNAAIKSFLLEMIKGENPQKPHSDMKFLKLIQDKFEVKMVRRTIAKYRMQLKIAGSSERKKLYQLGLNVH